MNAIQRKFFSDIIYYARKRREVSIGLLTEPLYQFDMPKVMAKQ